MAINSRDLDDARMAARIRLVEEHVRHENNHDLDQLMETLGSAPDFALNHIHISGRSDVRSFYDELFHGFPDFHIDVRHQHVSRDAVILEIVVTGTHRNTWRGIPATGRSIELPICTIFPFDEDERLAGERVYYDVALMLTQLGVLPASSDSS